MGILQSKRFTINLKQLLRTHLLAIEFKSTGNNKTDDKLSSTTKALTVKSDTLSKKEKIIIIKTFKDTIELTELRKKAEEKIRKDINHFDTETFL